MMTFKPRSEEEVKAAMLAPKGDYDFQVLEAEDTVSKSGNAMIKINIGIFRGEAMSNRVFDYLMPAMEAKLRHFCDTCGILAAYEAGTLSAEDCKGRSGRVKLIIEEDETGKYDPKNVVKDYICRGAKPLAGAVAPVTQATNVPELKDDSDVPF